jgi:hypothetical protein
MLKRPIVVLLGWGMTACSLPAAAQTLNPTTPLHYMPLPTPCRAVEATIPAGTFLTFNPGGGACSIPQPINGVIAYAINVTVTPQEGTLGFLAIWPAGDPKNPQKLPPTSTVNSTDGRIKANAAIVAGGYQGEVAVYAAATSATDLTLDVSGYFTTDADYVYVPITPCRWVDTRTFSAPFLSANQPRAFPLANNRCNLPPEMLARGGALSLNETAIPLTEPNGNVKVWGISPPPFPTVIIATPFVAANAAIVTMDQSASVSASSTTDVNLVMDITGYFASAQLAPTGLSLYLLSPCRVFDTRRVTSDHLALPTGFNGELTVPFVTDNPCSVPANAQAYVINATVVPLPVLGYLTLWADPTPQPVTTTLNAPDRYVASNMAIVTSFDGSIDAFASDPTEMILDVSGYFDLGP